MSNTVIDKVAKLSDFKIGTKVIVADRYATSDDAVNGYACSTEDHLKLIGQTGKVVECDCDSLLIKFKSNVNGSLHGEDNRCWWIDWDYLNLVPAEVIQIGDTVKVKKSFEHVKYFTDIPDYYLNAVGKTGVVTSIGVYNYTVTIGNDKVNINRKFLKLVK